ncbi:hypothetical protein DPMN_190132 [Dreissena polymorpha]|uniref:Transglutaminase-like domain-containing protein n=1 Tax=Dreissena polymorpha TaxID=45954 RepID=A0A9D4DU21_DREPO|nr:hypothetical protein DPMN_190132 [Dreissena polymorpha]
MSDSHNAHAWNSVYIDNDWFLVDVTWGAGFVKSKERKYVPRFTNAYFLTDPEVLITEHFISRSNYMNTTKAIQSGNCWRSLCPNWSSVLL